MLKELNKMKEFENNQNNVHRPARMYLWNIVFCLLVKPQLKDEIIKIKINYACGSINGSLAKLLIQKIN